MLAYFCWPRSLKIKMQGFNCGCLKEQGKHCVFAWWLRHYASHSQQNGNSSLFNYCLQCGNPIVVQVFYAFPQNLKPRSKTVKNRVDRHGVERYNVDRCPVWESARIHRLALYYKKKSPCFSPPAEVHDIYIEKIMNVKIRFSAVSPFKDYSCEFSVVWRGLSKHILSW